MSLLAHHSLLTHGGAASSTLLTGLLAYWDFDEASGNLINQLGDANFNGTLVGGVTQNQAGKVGTSYLFDGTTGYINLSSETLDLSTTDFTFDCWIKQTTTPAFVFDKRDASGDGFQFLIITDKPTFSINSVTVQSSAITQNVWRHILFTADRDGNGIIYINNVAGTPVSIAASGNINVTTKARIGARNFTSALNFFKGNMDEMGIWNRVLTAPEIAERYNSGNGNTYPFN